MSSTESTQRVKSAHHVSDFSAGVELIHFMWVCSVELEFIDWAVFGEEFVKLIEEVAVVVVYFIGESLVSFREGTHAINLCRYDRLYSLAAVTIYLGCSELIVIRR